MDIAKVLAVYRVSPLLLVVEIEDGTVGDHQKAGGDSSVRSTMRFSTGMTSDGRSLHENQGAAHRVCRGWS